MGASHRCSHCPSYNVHLVMMELVPKPAKHSDGRYMNALSDAHLYKVISEGGAAVGKSSMMAPWGMSLEDEDIQGVIVFIRSLADPPYAGSETDAS